MNLFRKMLVTLLFVTPAFIMISAYLKLKHAQSAEFFIDITLVLWGTFIVLAIIDIFNSRNLRSNERWMYAIAVLFLGWLGGLLYLLRPERKTFVDNMRESHG